MDGKPGSYDRTHHHPKFTGLGPRARAGTCADLSADPLGWLASQLADLPAVLERAGMPADMADPADAGACATSRPRSSGVTGMMLAKVRAGELGVAPPGDADSIRAGWL